jgi:hypothetical protein
MIVRVHYIHFNNSEKTTRLNLDLDIGMIHQILFKKKIVSTWYSTYTLKIIYKKFKYLKICFWSMCNFYELVWINTWLKNIK